MVIASLLFESQVIETRADPDRALRTFQKLTWSYPGRQDSRRTTLSGHRRKKRWGSSNDKQKRHINNHSKYLAKTRLFKQVENFTSKTDNSEM